MSIFGFPGTKYVYPTIMLIGIFLFLLRFAFGGEAVPGQRSPENGQKNEQRAVFQYSENDFINASEDFNDSIRPRLQSVSSEDFTRRTDRIGSLGNGWRNANENYLRHNPRLSASGFERAWDRRYNQELRRLEAERSSSLNEYREGRNMILSRMAEHNRDSEEYTDLQREIGELDRRHADSERRFEKQFRDIDATYAITRW